MKPKIKKKIKKKVFSLKYYKKKCDAAFSEYIRKRDKGVCFTCGKVDGWKRMDCGHFISRNHLAYRYNQINNHCQCKRCNIFLKGNMVIYSLKMLNMYGSNVINIMLENKNVMTKYSKLDYMGMTEKFKAMADEL